jgi:hypothetical protein
MSSIVTRTVRMSQDHFEPEAPLNPADQRRMRGYLEQIDYAAFAANREVLGKTLGQVDIGHFQRLAIAAAHARATWVSTALRFAAQPAGPGPEDTARLAVLHATYVELTEAYEALRRIVERGYCPYLSTPNRSAP